MEKSAGQPEKYDALIEITDDQTPLQIEITSPVKNLFGRAIVETAESELSRLGVTKGQCKINDYQAFDFVLKARIKAAVYYLRNSGGNI